MSDAPSDPWTFNAECDGKSVYATRAAAFSVMRRMQKKRRQRSVTGMRRQEPAAYQCDSCGQWHIGGFNKKGVKA